ncbi:hypothetical protein GOBAR_DD17049 [Gossypium barbadense]|nr:hypothetical protein GOBAR_DD17049 [Gossypium barbadense]
MLLRQASRETKADPAAIVFLPSSSSYILLLYKAFASGANPGCGGIQALPIAPFYRNTCAILCVQAFSALPHFWWLVPPFRHGHKPNRKRAQFDVPARGFSALICGQMGCGLLPSIRSLPLFKGSSFQSAHDHSGQHYIGTMF